MRRIALLFLLLLLLPTPIAAKSAVPARQPAAAQDDAGKLSPDQLSTLNSVLGGLRHAHYKLAVEPSLGSDPDGYLDAVWGEWQLADQDVLIVAGADNYRLRVQLGPGVSSKSVDLTALARSAYNPKAATDLSGALIDLAKAIDDALAQGGAATVQPAPAAQPARAVRQPWHNPLADVSPRYWWLVAAVVQALAAVLLGRWGVVDARRRRRRAAVRAQ